MSKQKHRREKSFRRRSGDSGQLRALFKAGEQRAAAKHPGDPAEGCAIKYRH